MNKINSQSPVPVGKNNIETTQMSFPQAMGLLIGGKKIRRMEWENKDEYCLLKDEYLKIHIRGKFDAWLVRESDLLATDWVIIK